MKTSFIKKLVAFGSILLCTSSILAQSTSLSLMTNLTAGGQFTLLTAPSKISQIQVMSGANNVTVQFYDNNVTNLTFTNAAYTNQINYISNVVYSSVSPLTGMTNLQTNSMLVSSITNVAANTNNLPTWNVAAMANTLATYPVNLLFDRGISINASTNCTVLISYRPN